MNESNSSGKHVANEGGIEKARRRAYQSPKILFREPLEAMAASCFTIGGKSSSDPACAGTGVLNS